MFPPFDQEEARKICLFIAKELDKGEAKLSIPEKESLERRGNGLMLGVLTGLLEEENVPDCQNLSAGEKKLSPVISPEKAREISDGNFSSEISSPVNHKKCIIVTVSGISRRLIFSDRFFESIKKEDFFKDALFYYAPPLVPQKEINQALAENDREIHLLTDKINLLKEKRRLPSGKYSDISQEEKNLIQKRLSLTSESLNKVYSLYNFKSMQGKSFSLMQIIKGSFSGIRKSSEKSDKAGKPLADAGANTDAGKPLLPRKKQQTTKPAFFLQDKENPKELQKAAILQIRLPPTGTGDCAAPKLLEKAIELNLKILSMAEIYYGKENKNRFPLQVYPPCDERCALILPSILGLEILYRDSDIVVINKESGLLSVPGRGPDKQDSVSSRLKRLYPGCIEQPAVHRLDMETSGIMVLALTKEAHRELNRQFESRETQKEYEALLDGRTPEERLKDGLEEKNNGSHPSDNSDSSACKEDFSIPQSGTLELYFRVDIDNRPHQIWDQEYGKKAVTEFHVLSKEIYTNPQGKKIPAVRIHFIPHTGRTHQLRLASADIHGLNHPIIGDTLYGHCQEGERLLLHAKKLSFTHPVSGQRMTFESKVPF